MKNYIHRDPKWFYRYCIEILNSDDRTIRNLIWVFRGEAKKYQKQYNKINRSELLRKQNKRYTDLPLEEKLVRLEKNRNRYYKNREQQLELKRKNHKETYPKLRLTILQFYGNGKLECVCCGENNTRFLTIDHVNNDGHEHRMKVKAGNLLRWIQTNRFPKGFQTLCFNCNSGRALNDGICPHKTESITSIITKRAMKPFHFHGVGVV